MDNCKTGPCFDGFFQGTVGIYQYFYTFTRVSLNNLYFIFLAFDCWRFCVIIRLFIPATTANDLRFQRISVPDLIHYIYFLILILEKEPVVPFQCSVLNKSTTGTIFITTLVWRGPWLGIEPGTSRTRSQHSTIRL